MDFRVTEDQSALRRGMRELLEGRFGRDGLRRAAGTGTDGPSEGAQEEAVGGALWRELAEAGFFALRLPEEDGGVGLGLPEAVLVFEEAGRALVPGPLVASHLAAGLVAGAADGTAVVTAADFATGGGNGGGAGEQDGAALVEHFGRAGHVLLFGLHGTPRSRSVSAWPAAGLDAEPVRSVDPVTPLHRVRRPGTDVTGAVTPLRADAGHLRREGALLTAAMQLGSAARTVEMAVAYARERRQFGQPVGAFQAVKHLCAQMLVRTETARSIVYAAALAEAESDDPAAKLLADEAAVRNARDCLQVYGGMGFTWEADVHLHLKRAWFRSGQWRRRTEAEEQLAASL